MEETKVSLIDVENKILNIILETSPMFSEKQAMQVLNTYCGKGWQVSFINNPSASGNKIKSISQEKEEYIENEKNEVINNGIIKEIRDSFEGCQVISVTKEEKQELA